MSQSPDQAEFRILIASDCHLGYNEKDHERGEDSFRAFEEVLRLANKEDVDFLLLGGDLFHANKPSCTTLQKCIEMLRLHCLGPRPIQFRILSDQKINFAHSDPFKHVNYQDQNLNVSMPVFSIHGNHDDPTGNPPISAVETPAAAGLINFFGKCSNLDHIELAPILLKKGNVQIALYGFGSINEERLHRIFKNGKFNYLAPPDPGKWFKILVVHQNRAVHPSTKYLPESFLTNLPDFVVWGHEHESRESAELNTSTGFFVYQPGSTVATSLSEAEALPKHVGLLRVFLEKRGDKTEQQFSLVTKPLKSVRVMMWESVDIGSMIERKKLTGDSESIENYAKSKVEEMIEKAFLQHSGSRSQPKLPLIRLRLEYSNENQKFHVAKFNANFNGRVANHTEVVHFLKKSKRTTQDDGRLNLEELRDMIDDEALKNVNLGDLIKEYFKEKADSKSQLSLLTEAALTTGVRNFVEKEAADAIAEAYTSQKEKAKKYLLGLKNYNLDMDGVKEQLKKFRMEQESKESKKDEELDVFIDSN